MECSYKLVRKELRDIYKDKKEDKFLKREYYYYRKLLLSLNNTLKKDMNGPLRYLSKKDILELIRDYLNKYFYNYVENFSKTTIEMYDLDTLIKYINASNDLKLNSEFSGINLTKEEAEDLYLSKGVTDLVFNDIKVVDYKNILTTFSIIHEYTHKIHNESYNKYKEYWYIFSEFLAYYNTYLFNDYLKSLGYLSDASIALNDDLITTRIQIKLFKLMDDLYYGKYVSPNNIKLINNSIELGNIPLFDYPHLIAYLSSKTKYLETKDLSLYKRTKQLNELLKKDISSKVIKENYLDISNRKIVKKLLINFNK